MRSITVSVASTSSIAVIPKRPYWRARISLMAWNGISRRSRSRRTTRRARSNRTMVLRANAFAPAISTRPASTQAPVSAEPAVVSPASSPGPGS